MGCTVEEASNDDEETKKEKLDNETSNDQACSNLHVVFARIIFLGHDLAPGAGLEKSPKTRKIDLRRALTLDYKPQYVSSHKALGEEFYTDQIKILSIHRSHDAA